MIASDVVMEKDEEERQLCTRHFLAHGKYQAPLFVPDMAG